MQINILEYLEKTVQRVPDKIAFSGEEDCLTFAELYARSRAIGIALIRDGFYKQPVVVFMKKQLKTIAAFLGVIYSGCFYVPLDDEMPRYRIELILQNLNPAACICDDTTLPIAQTLSGIGRIYNYDKIAYGKIDNAALQYVRDRQIDTDPIYIVFTSGSTGVPKGVVGCHRAVIDYIENLCEVLKFNENTVFGNQTPLYFDACLKEIIPTLKYGATTHLIPRKLFLLPVKLVEYLNEKKINTLCWVVSALTYISSFKTFEKIKPEYLQTIAFASEVFPIRQLNIWRTALPSARFINLYGPTETTGICCYYEVDRAFGEKEVLPVGRPFRNTDKMVRLCAEHGTQLVLVKAPSQSPVWWDQWDAQIEEYANKNDLLYINMLDHQTDIGIDWNTDTYDAGLHLNVYGAEKASSWFGKILVNECGIPDRRDEEAIASPWSEKLNQYNEQKRSLENEKD